MSAEFVVEEKEPGEHKISLLAEGNSVSWLTVVDLKMHYGLSEITVGGIANVYTAREFRNRGYSKEVINYAIGWMASKSYSLSALFGIPNYYDRYGFAVFMGSHMATLSLRNLNRAKSTEKCQITLSEDSRCRSREIAELYEENNIHRVASRVRNPESWRGFRRGVSPEHTPKVLVVGDKEVKGYAVLERWHPPDNLVVAEAEARGHEDQFYVLLLKEFCAIMLADLSSSLILHVPPDHPLIDVLLSCGCRLESSFPSSGGGMARIISLKRILMETKDELEQRSKNIEGSVCLCTPTEAVTLAVKDGTLELKDGINTPNKVKLGSAEVVQLILGYRSPKEIISSAEAHGDVTMLTSLFPKTTPYMWQPDRW